MASAKLLSAFVALAGVVLGAGAQSPAPERCPPCNKMLAPVCGADEDDETRTFPNSCMLRWCNCELRNADSDRNFKQIKTGNCEGHPSNETEIPECFPEMETTSEPTDDGDGPTSRTVNATRDATAAGAALAPGASLAVAAAAAALLAAGDL